MHDDEVVEVILATNPNTDGEVTAMYLARALADADVRVPGSRAACPSVGISSTPTRSPSARTRGRRAVDA